MRTIKLHFTDNRFVQGLVADNQFMRDIAYMNPYQLDALNIVLTDSVEQHHPLDTEVVVLSVFANAIKRNFFADTAHNIEFLNPFANQQKGGLHHNGERIIDSTDLELFRLTYTQR